MRRARQRRRIELVVANTSPYPPSGPPAFAAMGHLPPQGGKVKLFFACVGIVAVTSMATAPVAVAGTASLNIVLVMDGLRPDSITPDETPNLWRLRQEGVNFINGHSVFPTVTRVNATAIGTGMYPDRNGIFGNSLYVRAVDPNHA